MPKYKVKMSETVIYEVDVEAKDIDEAWEKAQEVKAIDLEGKVSDSSGFQIDFVDEIKE